VNKVDLCLEDSSFGVVI